MSAAIITADNNPVHPGSRAISSLFRTVYIQIIVQVASPYRSECDRKTLASKAKFDAYITSSSRITVF
ncbi:hypothetical protein D3C77_629930 [compost metagenome]